VSAADGHGSTVEDVPDTPASIIATYTPDARTMAAEDWLVVAGTVRAVVTAAGPTVPSVARLMLGGLTGLLAWCARQGNDLDGLALERVLTARVVNAYLATLAAESQSTYRSMFRRLVAAQGLPTLAGTPLAATKRKVPYTASETQQLLLAADNLGDTALRWHLTAIVALGFGCGVVGAKLLGVHADDVHSHGDELWVRAGDRCVPVIPRYTGRLLAVTAERKGGFLLGNPDAHNIVARTAERLRARSDSPKLSGHRLRATWIVEHMVGGTAFADLLVWSGLQHPDALGDYWEYAQWTPPVCEAGR